MTGARGFTLVELMVVIVVLAVFTAVIVPELSGGLEDARLRAAGRELAAVVRLAASRAVTLNRTHRLHVDPARGAYALEQEREPGRFQPVAGGRSRLDERLSIAVRALQPVLMGGPGETPPPPDPDRAAVPPEVIRFRPDGTADGREIRLRARGGLTLRLVVHPTTARIAVSRVTREVRP